MAKRKTISAGKRWKVFRRDGFKCVYCGSHDELVVDHGDPLSKGGEDSLENFVTACRPCNAGKRDSVLIPPQAGHEVLRSEIGDCDNQWQETGEEVLRNGVLYRNATDADWATALRHVASDIDYRPLPEIVQCITGEDPPSSVIGVDFRCDFFDSAIRMVNVVVVPLCDIGGYGERHQSRIRDAAILGYRSPTVLLMGSPWHFYAVAFIGRYKGCPAVLLLDDSLKVAGRDCICGWYPDESWGFVDFRSEEWLNLAPLRFSCEARHRPAAEVLDQIIKEGRHGL